MFMPLLVFLAWASWWNRRKDSKVRKAILNVLKLLKSFPYISYLKFQYNWFRRHDNWLAPHSSHIIEKCPHVKLEWFISHISRLQIGWHGILRLFLKPFNLVPGIPRFLWDLSWVPCHYVVLILNPMSRWAEFWFVDTDSVPPYLQSDVPYCYSSEQEISFWSFFSLEVIRAVFARGISRWLCECSLRLVLWSRFVYKCTHVHKPW